MPKVLTKSSIITCGHPAPAPGAALGQVDLTAVTSKLTVLGDPVVLLGDLTIVKGCPVPVTPSTKKCTKATLIEGVGVSTKLTVGGTPVMLDTVSGVPDGLPLSALVVATVQKKLSAI